MPLNSENDIQNDIRPEIPELTNWISKFGYPTPRLIRGDETIKSVDSVDMNHGDPATGDHDDP